MASRNNIVIAVSREHGSGGWAIAQEVAKSLKIPYVDSQLVRLATQRLGVPEENLLDFDERFVPQLELVSQSITKPSFQFDVPLSQVLVRRRNSFRVITGSTSGSTEDNKENINELQKRASHHKSYHEFMRLIIQDIALNGSAVIVGRGSQFILKDHPFVVRVHIYAPLPNRVQRLMQLQSISKEDAEKRILEDDRQRANFINHYFNADWRDPANYDLMLNTANTSLSTAANVIVQLARNLVSQPTQELHAVNTTYERLQQESYSLQEIAQIFQINPDILSQAVYNGELPAPVVDHRVQQIRRDDLLEWLQNRFR